MEQCLLQKEYLEQILLLDQLLLELEEAVVDLMVHLHLLVNQVDLLVVEQT